MKPDDELCCCFHVSRRKIVNWVRRERPQRASRIAECFSAGTGCGWCIPFLEAIWREVLGEDAETSARELSAEEYEALRKKYLAGIADGSCQRNRPGRDDAAS